MSCEHGNPVGHCGQCEINDALASARAEIADHERAYELLFKENAKFRELVRLIFETTVPYNERGKCVFTDKVLDMWRELTPNGSASLPAAEDARDAARFRWDCSGQRTQSGALVELELRRLNDDIPTLAEYRRAYDEAMSMPLLAAPAMSQDSKGKV